MSTPHHEHRPAPRAASGLSRTTRIALWMVAIIGGFYLLREHWNHVAGGWVYLLLLACPLMHLFHGHGGHAGQGGRAAPDRRAGREE